MGKCKVSVEAGSNGRVAFAGRDEKGRQVEDEFEAGTDVEVAMFPDPNCTVSGWYYNGQMVDSPGRGPDVDGKTLTCRINGIARSTHVNVTFAPLTYTVQTMPNSLAPDPHGTLSPASGAKPLVVSWASGQTFKASAASGYRVGHWKFDGKTVQEGKDSFSLKGVFDCRLHALEVVFVAQDFQIKPSAGKHGKVDPSEPFRIALGGQQLFTALPDAGYQVNEWLLDGKPVQLEDGADGTFYSLEDIAANHAVKVNFKRRARGELRAAVATLTAVTAGKVKLIAYPVATDTAYEVPLYVLRLDGSAEDGSRVSREFKVARFGVAFKETDAAPYVYGLRAGTYVTKEWIPNYASLGAWRVSGKHWMHAARANPAEATCLAGCIGVYGPGTLNPFNEALCAMMNADNDDAGRAAIAKSGKFSVVIDPAPKPPLKPWKA
ncbi:hypothetical protein GCM10025771_41420 [Niveibacterium umoris]|uniref:Bacterial repeat domain-containing protein n=1 Tax=Niveibacterium umoris TaxID=1193620 RepID=A0A840BTL4_9RHOO|nr:hypothetical protein [Niveibacterium umoris]MBB4014858.1 hypothetical protein [Niveibacterium umoris]